jgi:hypothetical protein
MSTRITTAKKNQLAGNIHNDSATFHPEHRYITLSHGWAKEFITTIFSEALRGPGEVRLERK